MGLGQGHPSLWMPSLVGFPLPRCHLAATACVSGVKGSNSPGRGVALSLSHRPPYLHLGGECSPDAQAAEAQHPTWTWVGLRGGWRGSVLGVMGSASYCQDCGQTLKLVRIWGGG